MTYPEEWDKLEKSGLIPRTLLWLRPGEERSRFGEAALGGACGLSGSWRGNGPPNRRRVTGVEHGRSEGDCDTAPTPTGGSSRESCAMGESLTQRHRVREDGLRVVNLFSQGIERKVPEE